MNIMDLVEAIAPECEVQLTGIRPGEKLHEVLVAQDEAWHTMEFSEMFVIEPTHLWWTTDKWEKGERPPDGFTYSSQSNPQRLDMGALREMVSKMEPSVFAKASSPSPSPG